MFCCVVRFWLNKLFIFYVFYFLCYNINDYGFNLLCEWGRREWKVERCLEEKVNELEKMIKENRDSGSFLLYFILLLGNKIFCL